MAKKKKNKNKYVPKYYTGGRLDMRSGGRVKLAHGGEPRPEDYEDERTGEWIPGGQEAYERDWAAWNAEHDNDQGPGGGSGGNEPIPIDEMTEAQKLAEFNRRRSIRNIEAGDRAVDIATGQASEFTPDIDVAKTEITEGDQTILGDEGAVQVNTSENQAAREGTAASIATPTEEAGSLEGQVEQVRKEDVAQAKLQKDDLQVRGYTAATAVTPSDFDAAQGALSEGAQAKVNEIRELSGPAIAADIENAIIEGSKAKDVEGLLSSGAFIPEVLGIGGSISETPQAERNTRQAITGTSAQGEEAQILETLNFEVALQQEVKGEAAQGAAALMIAQTADIPEPIASAIVQDPASVEAQIDTEPVEVQAAIAALPSEALVSSQMQSLLGGLQEGEVPLWAKPAVDSINQKLAIRGLSVSTVARDSLFNAIIQTALPIAQSNSQALQARAVQNLTNQQQANLQKASQEQQLRLQNLANRQTAESQSANMSQQMKTLQSQFDQQTVMATAQQQQQTLIQNLQNRQQSAVLNAQNQQAINSQNLSNDQQMEMANLEIEARVNAANQTETNRARLLEMQTAADFLSKNSAFKQQMNLANLSNDQQMRLANLTAQNQADSESLNALQQTELSNLQTELNVKTTNAQLAQAMGVAQLNVNQERAMRNAQTVLNMDMANLSFEQQKSLADSKWVQTATLSNLSNEQQSIIQNATARASLDLATVDQRTKLSAQNAQAFLQMDMTNLSARQQSTVLKAQQEQERLLSNQAAENFQRNATMVAGLDLDKAMLGLANQIELNNVAALNQFQQFNTTQQNAARARDADRIGDVNKTNAAFIQAMEQDRTKMEFAAQQWDAANLQAIRNFDVTFRRQINTAETAAQNAANMQTAMNAMGLTRDALSFLNQEIRDQADYDFRWADNTATRKVNAMIAAAGAEGDAAKNWAENFRNASTAINNMFYGDYQG